MLLAAFESRETPRSFGERAPPTTPQEALLYMLQAFAGLINAGKGSPRPPGDPCPTFFAACDSCIPGFVNRGKRSLTPQGPLPYTPCCLRLLKYSWAPQEALLYILQGCTGFVNAGQGRPDPPFFLLAATAKSRETFRSLGGLLHLSSGGCRFAVAFPPKAAFCLSCFLTVK